MLPTVLVNIELVKHGVRKPFLGGTCWRRSARLTRTLACRFLDTSSDNRLAGQLHRGPLSPRSRPPWWSCTSPKTSNKMNLQHLHLVARFNSLVTKTVFSKIFMNIVSFLETKELLLWINSCIMRTDSVYIIRFVYKCIFICWDLYILNLLWNG